MRKKLALLACILLISGCSDNSGSNECPAEPTCDGAKKVYCSGSERIVEACPEFQTCLNGECVSNGKCSESDEPRCDGNTSVKCIGGFIIREECQNSCIQGECIGTELSCEAGMKPYCDAQGLVAECLNGNISAHECTQGKVCSAGICVEKSDLCGNGLMDDGESCDDGADNGKYGKCRIDCSSIAKCGDGVFDASNEICDDGADNGKYGKCREDCSGIAKCGDGKLDAQNEICDDGADNGKYGKCRVDCSSIAECGDGKLDGPDEVCDDGENNGKTGKCSSDCKSLVGCGNGLVEGEEECDPPMSDLLIQCSAQCKKLPTLFEEYPLRENVSMTMKETCDPTDLWQKYLIYRERFLGNAAKHIPGFVSFGTEPGQSIPAAYRNPDLNCATAWTYNHDGCDCEFEDLADAQGNYSWADASLWLGIMVHWLALEYRTFKILGIDTSETEKNIALSLKAFDRIDAVAETFFGLEPALNGFFIRDDIPRDFFKNGDNYRFVRSDNGFAGYECAASSNTCNIYSGKSAEQMLKDGTFVSQDQITGLYEGFGMVAKFVDDDAEYDGIKLRHAARASVDRIIRYLKDHTWMIGLQVGADWLQIPDEWGGHAQMLSCFFAEGADSICGPDFGLETYHDDVTNLIKKAIPQLVSVLWPMWESKNNYNRNLILRVMNYTSFWTDEEFNKTSMESGREFWALSHALYHDRPLSDDYPLWHMQSVLASAPCDGPCVGDSCPNPTPGWMGEHYFVSPNYRVGYGHNEGEYNGLDYMIAHNLYFLAYAQKTGRAYTQLIPESGGSKRILLGWMDGRGTLTSFDVSENTEDMKMVFCGRMFADWVRDNALGLVDIYTENLRWNCGFDGKCTIAEDSSPYSHKNSLILGTNRADTINVPAGYHHCIAGNGGDDDITAGAGMHVVDGGDGNDTIRTNGPHVVVYGGDGDDKIYPGSGYHLIDAGAGNDLVVSNSSGTHLIVGGSGDDIIRASGGANRIVGGDGNDILEADSDDNIIWGNDGDDKIKLGNGDNIVYPGDGRAFILVGNGDNSIQTVSPQDDDVKICFGTGKNSIYAGWSSQSHCSAVQNSDIHDHSCQPDLTAADCSEDAYNAWK